MSLNFYETVLGRDFYEYQLPNLIKTLEKINNNLEQLAKLKEKELEIRLKNEK